jgi:hypothetical protein
VIFCKKTENHSSTGHVVGKSNPLAGIGRTVALLQLVVLLELVNHRGLGFFRRLPSTGLDKVADRIGYGARLDCLFQI